MSILYSSSLKIELTHPCRYYTQGVNEQGKSIRRSHYLPESAKQQFRRKQLFCYELPDLSREQEEDLFSRVQMGVQLNQAEKLRASRGGWQSYANLFEEDFDDVVSRMFTGEPPKF